MELMTKVLATIFWRGKLGRVYASQRLLAKLVATASLAREELRAGYLPVKAKRIHWVKDNLISFYELAPASRRRKPNRRRI